MSDPKRLLDTDGDAYELGLLRSAAADTGSEKAFGRTLAAMGAAAGVSVGAMAAAGSAVAAAQSAGAVGAGATAVATGGVFGLLKAIGIGALAGVVTLAGVEIAVPGAIVPRDPRGGTPAASSVVTSDAHSEGSPKAAATTPVASVGAMASQSEPPPAAAHAPHVEGKPSPSSSERPLAARGPDPAEQAIPVQPTTPVASVDAPPHGSAAVSQAASLQAEMVAIERVRGALASGDARGAIVLLDRIQVDFARPALGPEALVLRIEALVAAGERGRAQALADSFFASQPSSPHALRVRALLGGRGGTTKP